MTTVHLHFIIKISGTCEDAVPRIYRMLPWVLLREYFRLAGAIDVLVSAEAS